MDKEPTRAEYLKLLELHNANRIDYNTRKWETIKFFEGVFTALFSATIVALGAGYSVYEKSRLYGLIVSLLPLTCAIAMWLGATNLRRESRLLFVEELQVFKLAKFLNLDTLVATEARWLPGDQRLFSRKWRNFSYGALDISTSPTSDEWLEARMNGHWFVDLFSILFYSQGVFAIGVAAMIWFRVY